jgi:hypothetical protein
MNKNIEHVRTYNITKNKGRRAAGYLSCARTGADGHVAGVLKAPFKPAPIIDMLVSKGFLVYSIVYNQSVLTYFTRKSD